MPFNISLLGESKTANVAFVESLFRGKSDYEYSDDIGLALTKYIFWQTKYPWQEYVFFQSYGAVSGDDYDKKMRTFWMQSYSRHADVVIYSIAANEGEDKSSFIRRAKQALRRQMHYDRADAHALRYCIITLSANLIANESKESYQDLTRFVTAQGIEETFFTDNQYQNCYSLFDDFNSKLTKPSRVSRVLGYLFEALLGLATSLIVDNPVASFLNLIQQTQWNNAANRIGSSIALLFIPFIFPIYYLMSIFILPLIYSNRSGHRGWLVGLETSYYTIKDSFTDNPGNIVASFFIIALMAAAVLLTLGIFGTAVVGGIGLTALSVKGATLTAGFLGFGSGKIALSCMAGAVAFVAGSIIYGIGYGFIQGLKAFVNLITSPTEVPKRNSATTHSHQGPLEYFPTLESAVQPAPRAEKTPLAAASQTSLHVVTQPGVRPHQDIFSAASYRPVLTHAPSAATPMGSSSTPETPAPVPEASPNPSPPTERPVSDSQFSL
jgi:hypothetical protein